MYPVGVGVGLSRAYLRLTSITVFDVSPLVIASTFPLIKITAVVSSSGPNTGSGRTFWQAHLIRDGPDPIMSWALAAIPGSPLVNVPACQHAPSKAPPSRPHRLTIPGVYSHPPRRAGWGDARRSQGDRGWRVAVGG